jgi:hypothetical protein
MEATNNLLFAGIFFILFVLLTAMSVGAPAIKNMKLVYVLLACASFFGLLLVLLTR